MSRSSSSSSGIIIKYNNLHDMEQLSRDIASSMPMRRRRFIRLIQLIKFTHQALTRLINGIQQGTTVHNLQKLLNEFMDAGEKMEQNISRILPLEGRFTREMEEDIVELRNVGTNIAHQANKIIQNASQQQFGGRLRFGGQTISRITGNRLAAPYERMTGMEYPWYHHQPETYQERQERMREVQRVRQQREAYLQLLDEIEYEKYLKI